MNVAGWIFLIIIAIVAYLFIYLTIKINNMEAEIRTKSSDVDGNLWDRAFQLSRLVGGLEESGVSHEIDAPDVNTFALGMSAGIQSVTAAKLDEADEKLRQVLSEHPELKEDEQFAEHLQKFNLARTDMIKNSLNYNKLVNSFNSYIGGFPVSVVATLHKKSTKASFTHYFKELDG